MKSAQILRARLENRELTVGILATYHFWMEILEIAINAGMDYLIIDLEHKTHGAELVADACNYARRVDFPVMIRPARTDRESVRLALDLGPCGLMLPMIETPAQLDEARAGIYMPPRGERRPGGQGNRWVTDFNYETFKATVEDDLIVMPQIESPLGLEHVDAIAQHELTTALGVGPYDLSARLGVCWQPEHPRLCRALQTIQRAAEQAGKHAWMIGDGATAVGQGYYFVCIGEPMMFLENEFGRQVAALRSSVRPAR